jgi:hypothetical protein
MGDVKKKHVITIDPDTIKEGTCQILEADWGDRRGKAAVCKENNKIKIFPVAEHA